jgi:hypothetical protein
MKISLIYGVLFIALFGGLLEAVGIPSYFTVATELLIITLFLTAPLIKDGRYGYVLHLSYMFLYLLLVAIFSLVVNDSGIMGALYSLRLLFRFYLFYLAITTLELDEQTLKRINKMILIFLILQFPVIAYKFGIYGVSEQTIGAYAKTGGAVTAILPVVVLFYCAGFYYLYRPDLKYLFLSAAFLAFSIIGKKRVVLFIYPAQLMAIYYYIYLKGKGVSLSRKMSAMFMLLAAIVVISSAILYINPTLNPEQKVGGSLDPEYAIEFAKDYTTRENPFGYTTGRYATTVRIFKTLWEKGYVNLFFGIGPGMFTASILDPEGQKKNIANVKDQFKFNYGLTAMTRVAIEYGLFGTITLILIFALYARMSWKYYKSEKNPYWSAFAAGSVGFTFSTIFFFFAYSDTVLWGDTIPALYFWAMAVVYTRSNKLTGKTSYESTA